MMLLPWHQASALLDRLGIGGIDHHRRFDLRHQLRVERIDVLELFAIGRLQAHVDDVRAVLHLPARDLARLFPLLLGDHVLEQTRADHVGALADDQRTVGIFGLDQFDSRIIRPVRRRGFTTCGAFPSAICAMARICAGVVPQHPPTMFSQPCSTNFASWPASDLRRLQVLVFLVRQTRVRITRNPRGRHLGKRADVVRHQVRTGGAVQADRKQVGMRDRCVERVDGLPGEHRAPAFDGARNHQGNANAQFAFELRDGEHAGLDIACVEAGFKQQNIGAAFDQSLRLRVVAVAQLRRRSRRRAA